MNLSTEMMDAVVTAQHVADLVNRPGVVSATADHKGTPVVHLTPDKFAAEFGDHLDGMGVYTDDCYIKWVMVAGVKVFCLIYRKQPETCREHLKREHPEDVDPECIGGCYGCPSVYGYATKPSLCDGGTTVEICQRCWDRPIEEVDN